jgi:hypothetical protein
LPVRRSAVCPQRPQPQADDDIGAVGLVIAPDLLDATAVLGALLGMDGTLHLLPNAMVFKSPIAGCHVRRRLIRPLNSSPQEHGPCTSLH